MDEITIQKIDKELEEKEKRLVEELKQITVANPAVPGDLEVKVHSNNENPEDEDQYAHNITELDLDFALENELKKQLADVRKAKEKIKKGTYGICENCAQKIQSARLQLVPVASLCVECSKIR